MNQDHQGLQCPMSTVSSAGVVDLAIGEGAKASRLFLDTFIHNRFKNQTLQRRDDAAMLNCEALELAFTTDSFVVEPYFFPGGDIGKLAVCGTVNDLCMVDAEPKWLSLGLILEEGFPLGDLSRILDSVEHWCRKAKVDVVCGDTKVVPKGKVDGIFINTSGIGRRVKTNVSSDSIVKENDVVLVSGPIGCHGMSVMAARNPGLVETDIESDCGLLLPLVQTLRNQDVPVKAMRDATRGGVAAVLHEWARQFDVSISVDEACVPVRADVRGLTELLGLDPLFVANEGTMVVVVDSIFATAAVEAMRSVSIGVGATRIGKVHAGRRNPVTVVRGLGKEIPLLEPTGAPLPRIC
jgi:hydrogenase expression/formation protein HypE